MSYRARQVALLVGAAALLFVVAALAHWHSGFDAVRDHSSLRRNPWGTAAWRTLIEHSGVPTATWDRPLTALTPEVEMLVMLAPVYQLAPEETAALFAWVRAGGRLILAAAAQATTGGAFTAQSDAAHQLLARLGLEAYPGPRADAAVAAGAGDPLTADVRAVHIPGGLRLAMTGAGPAEPDDITIHTLLGTPDAAGMMVAAVGDGRVIVLAEAETLGNAALRRNDNVVLAANLIFADGAPGCVYFDEYHHGIRRTEPTPARPVDVRPLRHAALALMAVLVVFALGRARRFGAPARPADDRRVRGSDYVRAFAAIYARAGAAAPAAAMLRERLRQELARAAGMPASASDERLLAALQQRGRPTGGLAELLERLRDAADGKPGARELLELARAVAHYERML